MADREVLRYHFSGIAGAGMNPLARLMRAWGHEVQGSDRSLDQGQQTAVADQLRALGIRLLPQDGAAVVPGIDRFVYSTAVEAETPEVVRARQLGIERVPRPALLAEVVDGGGPGVAISGTSGKSTVTGMLAWILRAAGVDATVLGGAGMAGEDGGCFRAAARGAPVVAEACESDGTLIGYHPGIGVLHNISRDHGELDALEQQFAAFAGNCTTLLVNAGNPAALALAARARRVRTYGLSAAAQLRVEPLAAGPHHAEGVLREDGAALPLRLLQPGLHNLDNAAAAAAAARELGVALPVIAEALATFPGVARRFEVVGISDGGIRVVDDYAHNVEKIRATICAAQAGCERLVAVFQPHGFGPARFLRPELKLELPGMLRPHDRFCYAEIFYAGGTVQMDLSSQMLAGDLPPALRCGYAKDHAAVLAWVADEARPGDTVLLMGARDPRLAALARAIADIL